MSDESLPAGWTMVRVGDVCTALQYGYTASATSEPCGARFLRITDIQDGSVAWANVPYCEIDDDQIAKYALQPGDIVFARTGGTVGKSYLIATVPEQSVFASYLIRLTPRPEIVPKFLYYFFQSTSYWEQIGFKKGGLQGNVNATTLSALELPLCPTNEQRRVVAKLEELFSELDKGVESLSAAREQLKAYRQAVLKEAFDHRKAASGAAWRPTRLGDDIQFLTSGSRGWADYYADTGDIFIRAQNLKNDRLDLTDIAYVKLPPGSTEGVRTRVKAGDVLVTITGANVTKTGMVSSDLGPAYVSQHVALCRPSASLVPAFLYWYLLSEAHGRRQLNEAAYGAGKPGLNLDNIRDVKLLLPSTEEQVRIVGRIDRALAEEARFLATIEGELQRTKALRHSILTQAFCGRLVAQDPRDEAASTLLDRILTERKSERAPKKIHKGKNGRKKAA